MEKLFEIWAEDRYDLLVLDTPPTRNALDFLDAPRRLTEFVDSRSLQLFAAPAGLGLKLLGRGTGVVFSVMQRATGIDLLADLGEFFRSFAGMTEGFRERAALVNELLADSRTAFVLVTSPHRHALEDAVWFHHRLMEAGMPFAGVVANRVHQGGAEGDPAALAELLGDELARKVIRTYEDERRLAERDRAGLADLRGRIGRKPIVEIPHLHDDVHDLDGLRRMNEYLFA